MQTILWCIVTGLIVRHFYNLKVKSKDREIQQLETENDELYSQLCRARMSREKFESECG
jgi:hypothetical protein